MTQSFAPLAVVVAALLTGCVDEATDSAADPRVAPVQGSAQQLEAEQLDATPAIVESPCESARLLKVRTVERAEARVSGPVPPIEEGEARPAGVASSTIYYLSLDCGGKAYVARVLGGTPGFQPDDMEAAPHPAPEGGERKDFHEERGRQRVRGDIDCRTLAGNSHARTIKRADRIHRPAPSNDCAEPAALLDHGLHDDIVHEDAASGADPVVRPCRSEKESCANSNRSCAMLPLHARQAHAHVPHAARVARPHRHVLEVAGVAIPRKVLGVVEEATGRELVFEGFGQHRTHCPAWRQVRHAQEESVIRSGLQDRVVLRVGADVELDDDVMRVSRDGKRRADETLPSRARRSGIVVGLEGAV